MKFRSYLGLGLIALASCGPQQKPQKPLDNSTLPERPAPRAPPAVNGPSSPVEPLKLNNRPSFPETKEPTDPRSVEAAGQVVQHYGALIEQRRFREAAGLWSDAAAAADFAKRLDRPHLRLEIGTLGETEGAAGSIYTSVPVVFRDESFRRPANIILRRVNDVPGSTAAQRRWHIERIEWDKPG